MKTIVFIVLLYICIYISINFKMYNNACEYYMNIFLNIGYTKITCVYISNLFQIYYF